MLRFIVVALVSLSTVAKTIADPKCDGGHRIIVVPAADGQPGKLVGINCEPTPSYLPTKSKDAWSIVTRRRWGTEDFNRGWDEYVNGFGNAYDDNFLGLKHLHALTQSADYELWVYLEDWRIGDKRYAYYDKFAIGSKDQGYAITSLGKYTGNAGDSLRYHEGMKFSTFDKDHDKSDKESCAILYSSGWWFNKCIESNLHGLRIEGLHGNYTAKVAHGIVWKTWLGFGHSYKYVFMAIRKKE